MLNLMRYPYYTSGYVQSASYSISHQNIKLNNIFTFRAVCNIHLVAILILEANNHLSI